MEPKKAREDQEEMKAVTRTINVITAGFAVGGMIKSTHKKVPPSGPELDIRENKEDSQAIIYP